MGNAWWMKISSGAHPFLWEDIKLGRMSGVSSDQRGPSSRLD